MTGPSDIVSALLIQEAPVSEGLPEAPVYHVTAAAVTPEVFVVGFLLGVTALALFIIAYMRTC